MNHGAPASGPVRAPNQFGVLRLLFAFVVVVSHSPELLDGNRSREILASVFHTRTLGEVGLDGFFLISGYLIVKSWHESPRLGGFALRRALRIGPGYIVAFLLCWLVVGPLSGGHIGTDGYVMQAYRMITLQSPELSDAFRGLPYTSLDGPMWTIAYEVRCYIAAAVLGLAGAYRHRTRYVIACAVALLLFLFLPDLEPPRMIARFTGKLTDDAALLLVFLTGGAFYLFANKIRLDGRIALAAAIALPFTLAAGQAPARLGVAICGGYLLFWFALVVRAPRLARIGGGIDISYGLYLYAWPVQNLIVQRAGDIAPWALTLAATVIAGLLGLASWTLVERPGLALARRRRRSALA